MDAYTPTNLGLQKNAIKDEDFRSRKKNRSMAPLAGTRAENCQNTSYTFYYSR
jgi:hypothetical protein